MKTPTPRTDAEHYQFPMGGFNLDFARQLERELTAVTEQRDRLAEALLALRNNESLSIGGAAYEIIEQALQSLTPKS